MAKDNKHHEDDDYKLPPGIILPQEPMEDYPNWKKGSLYGIFGGMFGAFILWMIGFIQSLATKKEMSSAFFIVGGIVCFILITMVVAFRPPKN